MEPDSELQLGKGEEPTEESVGQIDEEVNPSNLTVVSAAGQITVGLENQMISAHTASSTLQQPIKQEPKPYYSAHRAHARALSNIIDRNDLESANDLDDCLDDCSIIGEDNQVPRPLQSTTDDLIKRDNDIISGDKPFTQTVRIKFS